MSWIEASGDPDAYWRQTPKLLALFFEGRGLAARERRRMLRWVAYHAGALSQVSKLPDLAAFLAEKGDPSPSDAPRRRQTAEEQYQIAVAWNARLGGKVIYREGP